MPNLSLSKAKRKFAARKAVFFKVKTINVSMMKHFCLVKTMVKPMVRLRGMGV